MVKIKGNANDNDLFGKSTNDQIYGGAGDDFIFGAAGNDTLVGGAGDDEVVGGRGNDLINGAKGDDTLLGGDGKDILIGGEGRDVMTGGEGNDIFRFVPGSQTPSGVPNADLITDFQQVAGTGGDILQLPSGSSVTYSELVKTDAGSNAGWYLQYGGGGNFGFVMLIGLTTAPDYEFV